MRRPVAYGALILVMAAAVAGCSGGGGGDASPAPAVTASAVATTAPTSAAPPTPTVAPRGVTMRLEAPVPAPGVGGTFTVGVRILGAANLGAYQFSPAYDSAVLELVSVQDGGFLASTGRPPTCSTDGVPGGQSTFYCVTLGTQPAGPSGDGALAVLEFRALAAGETNVTLDGATATMPDARDLPVSVEGTTVTVQ
jgi:hypothetical protein